MKWCTIVLLIAVRLIGCKRQEETSSEQAATAPAPAGPAEPAAPVKPAIHVDSALALLESLGPDRTLELKGGVTYRLDGLPRGRSDFCRWKEIMTGQYELVVRNCSGLAIVSPESEAAHIVTAHTYANVLHFEKCDDLQLVNLKVGHDPTPGYCLGGVIALTHCGAVRIVNCTLYGSGTEGLTLQNVTGLTLEESVIEECTYGLLSADGCDGLTFLDSQFRNTEKFHGFDLCDTVRIVFENCRIENNRLGGLDDPLFKTNLTTPDARIVVKGGAIRNNTATGIARPADMLVLEDVDVRDNVWLQSKWAPPGEPTPSPPPETKKPTP